MSHLGSTLSLLKIAEKKSEREEDFGLRDFELLGDFIELYASVEAPFTLWSCSPGPNPVYCSMPLVEKPFHTVLSCFDNLPTTIYVLILAMAYYFRNRSGRFTLKINLAQAQGQWLRPMPFAFGRR